MPQSRRRPLESPVVRPKPVRIAAGTALIAVFAGTLFLVARSELARSASALGRCISGASAVAAVVALASLYEWIVHRVVYHEPSSWRALNSIHVIHQRGHHSHRFPPDRYVDSGPIERIPLSPPDPYGLCRTPGRRFAAWLGQYAFYAAVGGAFAFLPAWLVTRNPTFVSIAVITGLVLAHQFIHVHDAIHYPKRRAIERTRWFQFLDHHHYIHHVDPRANLNLVLPLCDWLFGTLRLELTDAELYRWPSFEVAKFLPGPATPRGQGAPVGVGI